MFIHVPRDFFQKASKILFLIQGVGKTIGSFTFGWDAMQILFYLRKVSINQRFYCQLTMTQTFLCRLICKLIFLAVYCLDLLQCQISQRRFFLILWQCFHGFIKAASCVCPAAGNLHVFTFLFDGMIDLIAICYTDSLELLKEISWMACITRWLVIVQYDLSVLIHLTGTVHPHVMLVPSSPVFF